MSAERKRAPAQPAPSTRFGAPISLGPKEPIEGAATLLEDSDDDAAELLDLTKEIEVKPSLTCITPLTRVPMLDHNHSSLRMFLQQSELDDDQQARAAAIAEAQFKHSIREKTKSELSTNLGVYSIRPPVVSARNIKRNVLRLWRELQAADGEYYPTSAGNPMVDTPVRSVGEEGITDDAMDVVTVRPVRAVAGSVDLRDGGDGGTLEIRLRDVSFFDHELFDDEDFLASGLTVLYEEYRRRVRQDTARHAQGRLEALLGRISQANGDGDQERGRGSRSQQNDVLSDMHGLGAMNDVGAVEVLARDVLQCLSRQYDELEYIQELSAEMYSKWSHIRELRAQRQYQNTRVQLQAREVQRPGVEANHREGGGQAGDIPRVQPQHVDGAYQILRHLERLDKQDDRALHEFEGSVLSAGGDEREPGSELAARRNVIRRGFQLLHAISESIDANQDTASPQFAFRLSLDAVYTSDHALASVLSPPAAAQERQRRNRIRQSKYKLQVRLNDQIVFTSSARHMVWPDFTVPLHATITVNPCRKVSGSVHLLKEGFLSTSTVAILPLPIPGDELGHTDEPVLATTVPPYSANIRFSSRQPISVRGQPPGEGDGDKRIRAGGRHAVGQIDVTVLWTGGYLPAADTGRVRSKVPAADVPIKQVDPNDPRIRHTTFTDRQQTSTAATSTTSAALQPYHRQAAERTQQASTFEPDRLKKSTRFQPLTAMNSAAGPLRRHRLLRLRAAQPDQFKQPIPLREDDIRQSEHFRKLLRSMAQPKRLPGLDDGEFLPGGPAARAETRKQARLRDFEARVQNAARHHAGQQQAPTLDSRVKETSLPTLKGLDLSKLLKVRACRVV